MNLRTRSETGRQLAEILIPLVGEGTLVFALTPGGARVAFEVAQRLAAPMDLVYARRLEVPGRYRSSFGAVTSSTFRLSHSALRSLALPKRYVKALVEHEEHETELTEKAHRGAVSPLALTGRHVILVDDGIADPLIVTAAIASLRARHAATVTFAAPILTPALELAVGRRVDHLAVLDRAEERDPPMICDEFFAQTTWDDVREMVRVSREQSALAAM